MSSAERFARLSVGERFADRYEVESVLGEGGMGAVYRARDLALGEVVALKILAPRTGISPISVLRFRQEVKLARRVTHASVVRVFDLGEHDERVYLTMELVPGKTLSALLREKGKLTASQAASIGVGICEGLAAAHAVGVVHRDLKPSNIMITEGGRVVLTDFGIAQSLSDASDLTIDGMVVGTARYMAPEQLFREALDGRTDVYAAGLVLHEMLVGDVPRREQLNCAVDLRVDAPALRPQDAAAWQALLQQCLARDRQERFGSAAELGQALRALGGARTMSGEPPFSSEDLLTTPMDRSKKSGTPTLSQTITGPISVLPFQYVGPPESAHLGRTIADELVDTLAQIRGLKVLGTGATAPFAQTRDPVAIGAALRVTMVLDGTVQLGAGGRTRMTVRLLDARTGVQRWSDRHDGAVSDLFSFQISVARRLAERLRVELTMMSFEGTAPPEAIEGYLRARRDYRQLDTDAATSAFDGFERCVESAPGFLPAISAHAMAAARMWFFDRGIGGRRPWDVTARQSVARALAEAPDLPETHLAAAMLETQEVDFAAARRSLDRALSIAPTHVDTLEYLGMLLLEADLREEGVEKLELVLELDPARFNPLIYLARLRALDGDYEGALALHDKAEQLRVHPGIGTTIGPLRFAAWRADPASARLPERTIAHLRSPRWQLVQLYLSALRGEIGEAEAIQRTTFFVEAPQSARALSSVCQLLTEIWLLLGHPDRAFEMLDLASNNGLLDIAWIDRCPMLGPIRGQPGFPDVRSATLLRAAAMREA